jgi:hypothetical protein
VELWEAIAVATRYGNQPLSEVLAMTADSLRYFQRALWAMIEKEAK